MCVCYCSVPQVRLNVELHLYDYVLCVIVSLKVCCTLPVQCRDITVVEHPSSVLVPVNATAAFSCAAQCTPQPCTIAGQWIISGKFKSIISHQNEVILYWTTDIHKNASLRCRFHYFRLNEESKSATLVWIDGKLLCINTPELNKFVV